MQQPVQAEFHELCVLEAGKIAFQAKKSNTSEKNALTRDNLIMLTMVILDDYILPEIA